MNKKYWPIIILGALLLILPFLIVQSEALKWAFGYSISALWTLSPFVLVIGCFLLFYNVFKMKGEKKKLKLNKNDRLIILIFILIVIVSLVVYLLQIL